MERLDVDLWSEKINQLVSSCELSTADPVDLLTGTYHVLTTGPNGICRSIRPTFSNSDLQLLLDCRAFESAALRLLGKCSYMLSHSNEGLIIASVLIPSSDRDYSFNAASEVNALCGALMICLQESVRGGQQAGRTFPRRFPPLTDRNTRRLKSPPRDA
jgi:hypothetical protein